MLPSAKSYVYCLTYWWAQKLADKESKRKEIVDPVLHHS